MWEIIVVGGGYKFAMVKHSAGDSYPWGATVIPHSQKCWFTFPREHRNIILEHQNNYSQSEKQSFSHMPHLLEQSIIKHRENYRTNTFLSSCNWQLRDFPSQRYFLCISGFQWVFLPWVVLLFLSSWGCFGCWFCMTGISHCLSRTVCPWRRQDWVKEPQDWQLVQS